jgi:hypothetical protein
MDRRPASGPRAAAAVFEIAHEGLLHFAIGDGLSADFASIVADSVRPVYADGADVADSLLQSRQGKGELPLRQFRFLHRGFLGTALGFVAWALFARGRRLPGKLVPSPPSSPPASSSTPPSPAACPAPTTATSPASSGWSASSRS